ncbi:MAG: T9SS type A sorting domain-containing protein, partial [Bacteroidota bacterium]
WNNQPSMGTTLATELVPAIDGWLELDITATVNSELGGNGLLSIAIEEATTNTYTAYHSLDAVSGDDRPHIAYTAGAASRLTSVEILAKESSAVRLYPNPITAATTHLNVAFSLAKAGEARIQIMNLKGQVLGAYNGTLPAGQQVLQVPLIRKSNLSTGFYIYQVRTDEFVLRGKLLRVE